MEKSSAFRDRVSNLYIQCRCGNPDAYNEMQRLLALTTTAPLTHSPTSSSPSYLSTSSPIIYDDLVVKGYMGDLLLLCNSKLIQKNVKKGKKLLKSFSQIEHQRGLITCYHLQHLLAVYFQDCCDDKDIEAYEMFQLAADQGHAMSISTLGYFNDYGTKVVQKNPEKSFALYLQAANKGYPIAQCNVGKCYDTGQGIEKNQVLAAEWFHKSAEQGHVDALYNLGVFYQQGLGVELNFSEGYRYYKLAAIQGDAAAQYNTGWCYHQGIGVERDEESALYWMSQSAEQGDESAPLYLGLAYRHGWGVKANIVESVRYFKRTLKVSPNNEYSSNQIIKLMGEYKNALWHNRKAFLMFLWGCNFIYRPNCPPDAPSTGDREADIRRNNVVHETFYLHEMRNIIMSYI